MTTKTEILYVIRQKCLECSCDQPSEVRACRLTACDLWPFRFGRDPVPSRTRGFAKPSAYTGDLPNEPIEGTPIAALPRNSPNPAPTHAMLDKKPPSPSLGG